MVIIPKFASISIVGNGWRWDNRKNLCGNNAEQAAKEVENRGIMQPGGTLQAVAMLENLNTMEENIMGTANFKPMEYGMPMVCGGMEDFEDLAEKYMAEFGEELTEGAYYGYLEDAAENAQEIAENFTENLKFHDVTIIGGYYYGFQFYVEEKFSARFDLDRNSEYCIDNDDAHYYFDMCRSAAIRAADAEKRKICRWLENLAKRGYSMLVCTARFSNGEAMYRKVS